MSNLCSDVLSVYCLFISQHNGMRKLKNKRTLFTCHYSLAVSVSVWATAGPTKMTDQSIWHFFNSSTTISVFAKAQKSCMPSITVLFPQPPCPPLNHCQMMTTQWRLQRGERRLQRPTRYSLRRSRAMTHWVGPAKGVTHGYLAGKLNATKGSVTLATTISTPLVFLA
jgi:hypothetical protein